ncbi:hypothetical protein H2203_003842 [Taxawa tesnikishii (nom. ined.)]|nr:hypothetical protein H2203_003842 [Dothideales sp. JES 119]
MSDSREYQYATAEYSDTRAAVRLLYGTNASPDAELSKTASVIDPRDWFTTPASRPGTPTLLSGSVPATQYSHSNPATSAPSDFEPPTEQPSTTEDNADANSDATARETLFEALAAEKRRTDKLELRLGLEQRRADMLEEQLAIAKSKIKDLDIAVHNLSQTVHALVAEGQDKLPRRPGR